MDNLDKKILEELQGNGRITMTDLGKKINMTAPAVTERVRRLEEKGIISGYKAAINPEKAGKPITAFILFDTERCKQFVQFCSEYRDVMECHRLAGEYSYLVKIVTASVHTLEEFIDASMAYGKSSTLITLSSPVDKGMALD